MNQDLFDLTQICPSPIPYQGSLLDIYVFKKITKNSL